MREMRLLAPCAIRHMDYKSPLKFHEYVGGAERQSALREQRPQPRDPTNCFDKSSTNMLIEKISNRKDEFVDGMLIVVLIFHYVDRCKSSC